MGETMPNTETEFTDLSLKLFGVFARFEYALKAAGFHFGEGKASPNWTRFSQSLGELFDNAPSAAEREAVQYMMLHPPMRQRISGGRIVWERHEPTHQSRTHLLLLYVCRVRNNLFHGGKFHGVWVEPERDIALLKHSLTILEACLSASGPVREAYEN
jgi:hypothetical protein